jgi:molybdate transport system regulatory protein
VIASIRRRGTAEQAMKDHVRKKKSGRPAKAESPRPEAPIPAQSHHGRIYPAPDRDKCLDAVQLHRLEQSFRHWADAAARQDVRLSRRRILIIFLLIRYTGAKLSEVLGLDPFQDIDFGNQCVRFGRLQKASAHHRRKAHLSKALCGEIRAIVTDPAFKGAPQNTLNADPGFVRRKFYERAESCGIAKQLGAPENLRKSRAVELMQNNMPLPAVQVLLGHATPNLTFSYVSFSEEDIQQVTKIFMEKEFTRKTSARNSFFGKIQAIWQGDIQSRVEVMTMGGCRITTIVTNDSLNRIGLKVGKLITAEVKAPWVILQRSDSAPECSADNMFSGKVDRITRGRINTEYIVRISDGTQVCSMVTSESCRRLALGVGDKVWVLFNGFSVVLLSD